MPQSRRLAAIMFTDIVGYTAMMQENEQAAAKVRERHREIFHKYHDQFNGEVIQYYGDGTLSIFKSAIEAVESAIAMQRDFQEGTQVPLRIGIHVGDIISAGNEIYGDGVNLASRVESLGIPGAILISYKVKYEIQNQENLLTQSLGYFEFKNIKEPVEVFAISNSGLKVPARNELKGKLKQNKKSIAVLPFVNMSSDPENEYFSDGISEEILNALVKVEGLQVTARTSSFSFKGKNMDVREIGRILGVMHVLEGSVRKAGNRVRITAQLISTVDGYHLFSENYDRDLEDIFAVQDEIAQTISRKLREHLSDAAQEEKLVSPPTQNMEAYETYLRGLFYYNQFGDDEAMGKAIPYFEKAIEIAPDFGLPYASAAVCYFFQGVGGKISREFSKEKIDFLFDRLQEMGVESQEAYFFRIIFETFIKWDWAKAFTVATQGLKKYPNAAKLHHAMACVFWINGERDRLIQVQKRAFELDPLSIEMILYLGIAYLWHDEFDNALPYIEKVLGMVPQHRAAQEYKGWIHALREEYDQALEIFERLEPMGYRLHQATCLAFVYHKCAQEEKFEASLQELLALVQKYPNLSLDLAALYTQIEDFDQAFFFLEKAIKNRVGDVMMIRSDFLLKPLKEDPRFTQMEALVGEVPEVDISYIIPTE